MQILRYYVRRRKMWRDVYTDTLIVVNHSVRLRMYMFICVLAIRFCVQNFNSTNEIFW